MMFHLWFLIWELIIGLSQGEQFYDSEICTNNLDLPGTRYSCHSIHDQCETFLVYRANQKFRSLGNISTLFNIDPEELLKSYNNVTSIFRVLESGREVLISVKCLCYREYYEANFSYPFPLDDGMTLANISCDVFEGLVKSITLIKANPLAANDASNYQVGSLLHVPLKCACPDQISLSKGVKYLITYPFLENDDTNKVSTKFKVPVTDIWEANHIDSSTTVYPTTTILVPLKTEPSLNFQIPYDSDPPTPGFLPTQPVENTSNKHKLLVKVYVSVSVLGAILVLMTLLGYLLYVKALKKCKEEENVHSFARRSSFSTPRNSQVSGATPKSSTTNSCLSPDLLDSLKYSLCSYSIEELKKGTNNFSEENKIGDDVYKGLVENDEIMIKETRFDDTRQVIDLHSRINHVKIVKLEGVCYCDDDSPWSYLIFEFPPNGCLRDCLSSPAVYLRWNRRTQIAFDIATGLHYLHYCMVPPCTHLSVNSKTIFLTRSWRAKLAVFDTLGTASKDHESVGAGAGGWDHFIHGSAVSEKEDIFAFGVVLLQLISGRENEEWTSMRESITFLGVEGVGCFDQLRNFVDQSLKEDYPLAEALCLAVLAKACVEDEALHRPSMDDILKVLARMV
ncbi:hypothetical protein M9H77_16163 [Catharanthus roseus]|uniref:Uncharacterized protein n=1 Tax=Catharanthus roseus TaxID=4058 RepID=A0ACC0AZK4_CATRO|nr:hypothetical protein M9H77_16163 [Catharanthus roseus]